MNIRFSSQAVRARITEEEVDRLLAGEELSETLFLPANRQFRFGIRLTQDLSPEAETAPLVLTPLVDELDLQVAKPVLQTLKERRPSKDRGIHIEIPTEAGPPLKLSLEIDLIKLKERANDKIRNSA
jgi:hypothetical protein